MYMLERLLYRLSISEYKENLILFDAELVRTERIKEDAEYEGISASGVSVPIK